MPYTDKITDDKCVACGSQMNISHNHKGWFCPLCKMLYPKVPKAKLLRRLGFPLGKWFPSVHGDVVEKKSQEGILLKALAKLKAKKPNLKVTHTLSDKYGVFGYCTNLGVLLSKKYIYGFFVSAHKAAIFSAWNSRQSVIMYIDRIDKFYAFSPRDIIADKETFSNMRGDSEMVNFKISLGQRYC